MVIHLWEERNLFSESFYMWERSHPITKTTVVLYEIGFMKYKTKKKINHILKDGGKVKPRYIG